MNALVACPRFEARSKTGVDADCEFTIAGKQLRTRDCHRCTIFLYSKTDPVIETSSWLKFAPFNGAYPGG